MGVSLNNPTDSPKTTGTAKAWSVERIRADFPILATQSHGRPLVYLDNGATTQKPQAVIDAETKFYRTQNANIHRGVYELSQAATKAYEDARHTVASFVNAAEDAEIIFTRGTTESINLVAAGFARSVLKAGDEIIVTALEHHSNIVPWQMAAELTGAVLKVIPINDAGELRMDEYAKLLGDRTKVVAVTHLSNALGTINDAKRITALAHERGAAVLIDGAQWIAHHATDVREIGCDFYAFSSHKLYGPTGVGVLYGKRTWLDRLPPYQGGGDMIETVSFEKTTYAPLPNKFEAGTPNIAGVVGLAAAIDYLRAAGLDAAAAYERDLIDYATKKLSAVGGLRILGSAREKGSVISFVVENPPIASLDLGMALDREGIAVRTGHHCCMPLMARLSVPSTTRASFAMYNTKAEVDLLVATLTKIISARAAAPKVAAAQPSAASNGTGVSFPTAAGESPNAVADEIAEVFEFLGDKEAKGEQLLDYAKELPHNFDLLKRLTERVPGCQAQVYLVSRPSPTDATRLEFVADADAEIVRGEIQMLQQLFSGQKAKDILAFDVNKFFTRIGLEHFLSAQRRNGLGSMIERIRGSAAKL
ncbi:hypothetical protein BH10PLA1_BH10PLA1_20560 [soil metagenome]